MDPATDAAFLLSDPPPLEAPERAAWNRRLDAALVAIGMSLARAARRTRAEALAVNDPASAARTAQILDRAERLRAWAESGTEPEPPH